jgi:PIN domain nuclease of toxin-antitoxin system
MKLLLDTHAFLFSILEPERLSETVRELLQDPEVARWVSVVSIWEIAVKIQIGKLELPTDTDFYRQHLQALGVLVLAVGVRQRFGKANAKSPARFPTSFS